MFITAADIGKFLSETLLKSIKYWSKFIKFLKVNKILRNLIFFYFRKVLIYFFIVTKNLIIKNQYRQIINISLDFLNF